MTSTSSLSAIAGDRVFESDLPAIEIPDVSLPEFLFARAAERGAHPALVDAASGRSLSHAELADGMRRVAAGLAARGLRKGEVFAILAPNTPDWLVAAYGAMTAGAVVTGINPLYTADEIATQLADSDARFLLTAAPFLPAARAAVEQAGGGARIVVLGAAPADTIAFTELVASTDPAPQVSIDPASDLALLPYSSGTTGLPKGVMLTHRACVANVLQTIAVLPSGPDDRALAVAPFFHAVGFGIIANTALSTGATVVTLPRFEVPAFLSAIQDHRITQVVVVPPIILALAKHPIVDQYDVSSLQWVGCGAAPLGGQLQQACTDRLRRPVGQGYGMTEGTAGIALQPVTPPGVPGSAGRLLSGVRARIVDLETGADLGPGETGELWIHTIARMTGYLHNPGATAATIDDAGWLHTGDIARIDDDGNLIIVDRLKELIKVKGFQVAPAELEAILRAHPAVADAAVVPMPDERAGELPKAFVVAAREVSAQELIDYVTARVAPHKRIHEVEFLDQIPTSPAGKTLRRLLRDRAPTG